MMCPPWFHRLFPSKKHEEAVQKADERLQEIEDKFIRLAVLSARASAYDPATFHRDGHQ
ncbi:MAG: hypothetical protein KGL39_05515 [Patescibacteria group bacterium]|nr:hypothetical protein [Patescibacteria group bacterium]